MLAQRLAPVNKKRNMQMDAIGASPTSGGRIGDLLAQAVTATRLLAGAGGSPTEGGGQPWCERESQARHGSSSVFQ